MVAIHTILSNMVSLYALIMGVWGLFNFIRRQPPDGNYNGALVLAIGLFVVQGLVGVIMVLMGLSPARWVHFLYGVSVILTIPAIFAFTRGSNTARESMLYGLGMLFIWGLAQRAVETAG